MKADFYGKVSPDGRYIPYTDWSNNGDLFSHDLSTGADRRLTNTADDRVGGSGAFAEEAAFSRDCTQIAYAWSNGKDGGFELRLLRLHGVGVQTPRTLVKNGDINWIFPYDWSPDGEVIAAHLQRADRSAQIVLISVRDGSLRTLKSVEWRGPSGIFFSPDGKYLAYDLPVADDPTGQRDIFVLAADGSREIPAIVHPSHDSIVGWSPDGKYLLFTSDRSGVRALWKIAFSGGKTQGIPEMVRGGIGEPGNRFENLGVTSSGAVYSAHYDPGGVGPDIRIATLDVHSKKFMSSLIPAAQAFLGTNMYSAWSPDGTQLAYVSFREEHIAIGIRSMETGQVRDLVPSPNFPSSPGYVYSLTWVPDGASFIVTGRGNKDGFGVFRVDAKSGRTSLLVRANSRYALLSRDGNTLYYRSMHVDVGETAIVRRDLSSGDERELIRRKFLSNGPILSPDGRHIGLVGSNNSGCGELVVMPAGGGAPRQFPNCAGSVHFSPDSRYIATRFDDPNSKSNAVVAIPLAGGEARELMRASDQHALGIAMWAPDSRSLFVKTGSLNNEDIEVWRILLENGERQRLEMNADHTMGPFLPSPDGQHIALQTQRSMKKPSEIWLMENFLPKTK
jgi:Tol biopolymer transport system component